MHSHPVFCFSADELYGQIFDLGRYEVMIDYTGNIRMATAGTIQTICILDVTLFPFDAQVCHIEVDSWTLPYQVSMRNKRVT